MNTYIALITNAAKCLLTWASLISLRGTVVILGAVLAITSSSNTLFTPVDRAMLQLESWLFSTPSSASSIGVISVPRKEIDIWQKDIHSSGKLTAILSNVLNSPGTTVGLLLTHPVDTGSKRTDELFIKALENTRGETNKEVKALVDSKSILVDLLRNSRVVIGAQPFFFTGQKPLLVENVYPESFPTWVAKILWPQCRDACISEDSLVATARPKLDQMSAFVAGDIDTQLFFLSSSGDYYHDFLVEFLRALHGQQRYDHFVWTPGKGLNIGDAYVPTDHKGSLIPVSGLNNRLAPMVTQISLDEALARNAFPRIVLIAAHENPLPQHYAEALYSIEHGEVLYSPWWVAPATIGFLLIVTVYLGLFWARLSFPVGMIATGSIFMSVLVLHLILTRFYFIWLPIALPLIFLFFGNFLLLVWTHKKQKLQGLIDRADGICIDQAKALIAKKQLDSALEKLSDCSLKPPLLQTLYDISEAYTEESEYQKAVEVLQTIKKCDKSFRDTEEKLQVLTSIMHSHESEDTSDMQSTQILANPGTIPTSIGRYELQREIGRGAMGQVYLGFDPHIARKVAIKTLSYVNFKKSELRDIRARFFREAEAAGRLSHPAIVSVYDVGEEEKQAFIAMDYVEGKPLNLFVHENNLLPVFEVYRIIYDVAMALDYAHLNNIVHRDVKPGNIIYNPSPYQIKVTDFGIARLVDNSKTSTGEILGSPLYMAPEQLKGKRVDRSADIFSLGVTFYQLLTGRLPYEGDNLAALTYEIIHGKHRGARTLRKDLPASASRITNQALQKDPSDRYETAEEMALVVKNAIKRDFPTQAKKMGLY